MASPYPPSLTPPPPHDACLPACLPAWRAEMVMFQLMVQTSHPAFKAVSALCKEARPDQLPPN